MTRGRWRLRAARWLATSAGKEIATHVIPPAPTPDARAKGDAWPELCEQFGLRLLVLAEQLRPALDALEDEEESADRLRRLFHVDHGVTRMRRVARDLRVLAGREGEEFAGHVSSLVDVIRVAVSAIEFYERVVVGRVAELAVVAYAADDVASLLAALADNATRYSPSQVTVSAHLLADGGVMVRIEDAGLGVEPGLLATVNGALSGPVPPVESKTGRRTGFAVVHRLACKYGLWVQLARRQAPGPRGPGAVCGTVAMVRIPASLLCEIPERPASTERRGGSSAATHASVSVPVPRRPASSRAVGWQAGPVERAPSRQVTADGLPRRERGSIRVPASSPARSCERRPAPDPGAAGRSFAVDVDAFASADPGAGPHAATDRDGEGPRDAEGPLS